MASSTRLSKYLHCTPVELSDRIAIVAYNREISSERGKLQKLIRDCEDKRIRLIENVTKKRQSIQDKVSLDGVSTPEKTELVLAKLVTLDTRLDYEISLLDGKITAYSGQLSELVYKN